MPGVWPSVGLETANDTATRAPAGQSHCSQSLDTDVLLQNLVPLVLRPLRLFLPAEKLRAVRIFLLKATHFPFVALILGWESWQLYWSERAKSSSGLVNRGLNTPTSLRRPRTQLPVLAAGTRQISLDKQTRIVQSPTSKRLPNPAARSETFEALEVAVDNLRTQLETITSIIANERRARPGGESNEQQAR